LRPPPAVAVILLHLITMISSETTAHIENLQKRAGHLWRFL
jgi:hypothetical protein